MAYDPRDLLFSEICELFRNPKREWALADELIALLARLGLLNSQPVRDAELERLTEELDAVLRHDAEAVRMLKAAEADLERLRKELNKARAVDFITEVQQAEAERDRAAQTLDDVSRACDGLHELNGELTAERDALKAAIGDLRDVFNTADTLTTLRQVQRLIASGEGECFRS